MHAGCEYPSRVAMVSMHTSPLATPGVGDAGGLNVYVAELARRLGERGLKVDVFTRRDKLGVLDIVDVHEHTRVIHLKAGPAEYVPKEALQSLTEKFCAQLEARLDAHDLIRIDGVWILLEDHEVGELPRGDRAFEMLFR